MSLIVGARRNLEFGEIKAPFNSSCPVCSTDWQREAKVTQLACKHLYCNSGCIEDVTQKSENSRCALCRDVVVVDYKKAEECKKRYEQTGRHLVNPNSVPAPLFTSESYANALQYVRLFGSAEQKAKIDRHENLMAFRQRQEVIAKRILLVAGPLFCVGVGYLAYYLSQNK